MMENYNDYKDLYLAVINSNMPDQFASIDERIIAMTDPKCLPGELEIVATCRALKKQIRILGYNNREIASYGDKSQPKLYVRFRNIGQDVGHYDCVVMEKLPQSQSQSRVQHSDQCSGTQPTRRIDDLLQEPHLPKRRRTNRCEKATVLTSSPSRASLEAKRTRQEKKSSRIRQTKTKKIPEKISDTEHGEEEDWPCLECLELYRESKPGAVWVQCQTCLQWAHEDCTGAEGEDQFICRKCN